MEHYRLGAAYACEERLGELIARERRPLADKDAEAARRKRIVAEEYLQVVQDGAFVPDSLTPAGFKMQVRDVVQD